MLQYTFTVIVQEFRESNGHNRGFTRHLSLSLHFIIDLCYIGWMKVEVDALIDHSVGIGNLNLNQVVFYTELQNQILSILKGMATEIEECERRYDALILVVTKYDRIVIVSDQFPHPISKRIHGYLDTKTLGDIQEIALQKVERLNN